MTSRDDRILRTTLYAVALLLPWQLFVALPAQVDVPLAAMAVTLGAAWLLLVSPRETLAELLDPSVLTFVLMLAMLALSTLLATGRLGRQAINVLAHLSLGALALIGARGTQGRTASREAPLLYPWLRLLVLSSLPLSAVGVALMLRPDLEMSWLSAVSGLLVEADTASTGNNVVDLTKIGLVFVNCNVGAAYWGLSLWASLWFFFRARGRWDRLLGALSGVLFVALVLHAGSRAALLALLLSGGVAWLMALRGTTPRLTRRHMVQMSAGVVAVVLVFLAIEYVQLRPPMLSAMLRRTETQALASDQSVGGQRGQLWSQSVQLIAQSPLRGHGVVSAASLGLADGKPPHNMYLQVGVYGGLPALLALLALLASTSWRLLQRSRLDVGWMVFVGLLWVGVQGLFTNLLIGDPRISVLLWTLVGLALARRRGSTEHDA